MNQDSAKELECYCCKCTSPHIKNHYKFYAFIWNTFLCLLIIGLGGILPSPFLIGFPVHEVSRTWFNGTCYVSGSGIDSIPIGKATIYRGYWVITSYYRSEKPYIEFNGEDFTYIRYLEDDYDDKKDVDKDLSTYQVGNHRCYLKRSDRPTNKKGQIEIYSATDISFINPVWKSRYFKAGVGLILIIPVSVVLTFFIVCCYEIFYGFYCFYRCFINLIKNKGKINIKDIPSNSSSKKRIRRSSRNCYPFNIKMDNISNV